MDYSVGGLKAFAVTAAERASGRPVDRDDFDDNTAWIDDDGPPGTP